MRDTISKVSDELFAIDAPHGISLALVVLRDGGLVFERYGVQPDSIFGRGGPVSADTTLSSWSMAKSITHAAVGIALADGLLDLHEPANVEGWKGTAKDAITLQDLLDMRPGLEWVEDYVDDEVSHCLEMLFGEGQSDMAKYAAALPLVHAPGSTWNYSSGTTNIICKILGDAIGGHEAMERFLRNRLFEPVGMQTATAKFDASGTFVGSSYVFATARDFAKFGELYRNDGVVGDRRVLPAGWRDHGRTFVAHDENDFDYGSHWWMWRDQPGSMACHGYEGQYCVVVPHKSLVLVHLGKCPAGDARTELTDRLRAIVNDFERVG